MESYSNFNIGVNDACLSELSDDVIADDALMHTVDAPRASGPDTKCGCKRKDVLAKYPAAREYSP